MNTLTFKLFQTLIIILIAIEVATGQNERFDVYEKIEAAKQVLITTNIDTFLVYTTGCVGCEILYDEGKEPTCACENESLEAKIVWHAAGRSYMKTINCCNETETLLDSMPDVFTFYEANKANLKISDIGVVKTKSGGGKIIFLPPSVSHYSFQKVDMRHGASMYEFVMKDYQKEGEHSGVWKKYKWIKSQIEWVDLINSKLMPDH
jgi:hypothetical protein